MVCVVVEVVERDMALPDHPGSLDGVGDEFSVRLCVKPATSVSYSNGSGSGAILSPGQDHLHDPGPHWFSVGNAFPPRPFHLFLLFPTRRCPFPPGSRGGHVNATRTQTNQIETPSQLDFDGDPWSPRTTGISARIMLPLNPYTSDVKLTLSDIPEEQEQSRLLIADLLTNEVAAARIESFSIEYLCTGMMYGGEECKCGDFLDLFVNLINRGGDYLKALKRVKWVLYHTTYGPRF